MKKKLAYVATFLTMLSLIYSASSYTSATVNCNASIKITESKDALIAIDNNVQFEIEKGFLYSGNVEITNNFFEPITIQNIYSVGAIIVSLPLSIVIPVGEKISVPINIYADLTSTSGFTNVCFETYRKGGSTTIDLSFYINVVDPPIMSTLSTTEGAVSIDITPLESSASIDVSTTASSISIDVTPTGNPASIDVTLTESPASIDITPTESPASIDVTPTESPASIDVAPS